MFETDRGVVETPAFMPVGTRGAVKTLRSSDLDSLGAQIILGNTYHLLLRPGTETLSKMGGLHRFMNWKGPILTDSGGFQIFSLQELRSMDEDGVDFRSHIDGTKHRFTPESVVDAQRIIGSDIAMVLDECPPALSDYDYHRRSMERSMRWARRASTRHLEAPMLYGHRQFLFGIVQGGTDPGLRRESAQELTEIGFDGYAIGGLAVGEPTDTMYSVLDAVVPYLPSAQPRYLMGVGTPENLLESIARGVDMFDCVMPTRNARNGTVFTSGGKVNLRNARHREDSRPIDSECDCESCRNYSRGYIRHLLNVDEITGLVLATLHNLRFYLRLMEDARNAIRRGDYSGWMRDTIGRMNARVNDTFPEL